MPCVQRVTLATLAERKRAGEKFAVLTCYDCSTARILAAAGMDVLLVGDSAAEVVLGHPDTRRVSVDFLVEITAAVRRGAPGAFLIADLPYAAGYHDDPAAGVTAARRFAEEAGCDVVKIELHREQLPVLEAVRAAGIGVMAHVGLRPQWVTGAEGYRGQGKDAASAMAILEESRLMEEAGASMLLLEAVAAEVAAEVCSRARIPVVGCVSGPACDGTVVVLHDILGWGGGHPPKSVRRYTDLHAIISEACGRYRADVREGRFPAAEFAIRMTPDEYEQWRKRLAASGGTSA